ncbi:hypothetical protein BD289DRAFT_421618 [Coniella lustricola]|uniref:Uncharacterized protein n=1 Tax=Coniella lustricola TaxID=2025994 RepID=A0A2T3ALM7_9PEZI|nr:hypothetical protein BD289DRAFT_421618 [Coniella lustricola]
MDTRSSSGSRSTVPSQESQPRQPTYTTVGSVAKPQSNTPLQPPVRRGRALRWPPAVADDLAAFNQSLLANLPRGRPRSPATTASTLQHYTPLQQNSDRAIDPAIANINSKDTPAFPFMSMALGHLEPLIDLDLDKENVPLETDATYGTGRLSLRPVVTTPVWIFEILGP